MDERSKQIFIPVDCIGLIVEYCSSSTVFSNIMCLNSQVKFYLECEHPQSCRNIEFWIDEKNQPSGNEKVTYVIRLGIYGRRSIDDLLVRFPNVQILQLRQIDNLDYEIFRHIPDLESLELYFCHGVVHFRSLKRPDRLKKFSFTHLDYSMYTQVFLEVCNLEVLDLFGVKFQRIDFGKNFRNLKKLKKLSLENVKDFDTKAFKYFGDNLLELEMDKVKFTPRYGIKGFKYLKKLENLSIANCDGALDEEITRIIGKIPRHMSFRNGSIF